MNLYQIYLERSLKKQRAFLQLHKEIITVLYEYATGPDNYWVLIDALAALVSQNRCRYYAWTYRGLPQTRMQVILKPCKDDIRKAIGILIANGWVDSFASRPERSEKSYVSLRLTDWVRNDIYHIKNDTTLFRKTTLQVVK